MEFKCLKKVKKRRCIKRVTHLIEVQTWAVCMCVLNLGFKSTHALQSPKSSFPVNGVLKAMKKKYTKFSHFIELQTWNSVTSCCRVGLLIFCVYSM